MHLECSQREFFLTSHAIGGSKHSRRLKELNLTCIITVLIMNEIKKKIYCCQKGHEALGALLVPEPELESLKIEHPKYKIYILFLSQRVIFKCFLSSFNWQELYILLHLLENCCFQFGDFRLFSGTKIPSPGVKIKKECRKYFFLA